MAKKINFKTRLLVAVIISSFACGIATGEVIYVDADASMGGDGTSWATAYKYLQDALYKPPSSGDEIWVAEGTYKPDANSAIPSGSGNRTETFQLINGVGVYGGFAGGETSLDERDWESNETILSGDIGVLDANSDNSYNVVTGSGTEPNAVLDGFTITAGNASGTWPDPTSVGGGMHNSSGSPTLVNCTFTNNYSTSDGAGHGAAIYNYNSSPTVTNCTFIANAADYGGGMYNDASSPTVTSCTFSGNSAINYGTGGGMCNFNKSNVMLTNCTFSGNLAGGGGGGMFNGSSSPTLTNCTFSGNLASDGGGMENFESSTTVTNCTFSKNSAGSIGGGMVNWGSSGPAPTVTNCAFSGNSASSAGGMLNLWSSTTVTNCTFTRNSASNWAGGMYNDNSNATITNCTFSGNSAGTWGGGMVNLTSSPTLTNCTFSGNSADSGGGMYNYNDSKPIVAKNCTFSGNTASNGNSIACDSPAQSYPSLINIMNCILWDGGSEIWNNDGSTITISYSDVAGGYAGTGNINADPSFEDADGPDNIAGTEDDNLRLSAGSPCIDDGNNDAVPADITDLDNDANTTEPIPFDLDGRPRFADGDCNDTDIVDMGAYEFAWVYIGDFAGGCDVDFADFAVFALAWLTEDGDGQYNPACDISLPADSFIDEKDLKIFTDNWQAGK